MGREIVYYNDYMALFSDGTLGLSDGVGCVDTLSKEKTIKLGEAIIELTADRDSWKEEKLQAELTRKNEALKDLYDDWKHIEHVDPDIAIKSTIEKASGKTWEEIESLLKEVE